MFNKNLPLFFLLCRHISTNGSTEPHTNDSANVRSQISLSNFSSTRLSQPTNSTRKMSSASGPTLQQHRGKTKESLELLSISQRTVKISNIPTNLSVEDIRQLFKDDQFEKVHVPLDLLNKPLGIAYVVFDTPDHYEQYLQNLGRNNKYLFIENELYRGPLSVESYDLPDVNLNRHLQLKMTNPNDPADIIAMKIGKLYVDLDERRKTELASELEKIKLFEEEEALRELRELEELRRQSSEEHKLAMDAVQLARVAAQQAKEKEERVEKQIAAKREELKRKFGSK